MPQFHRLAFCIALATIVLTTTHDASAYTYKVIHDFCSKRDCSDGATPQASLVMDSQGNLYGTTVGESGGAGAVAFELVYSTTKSKWESKTLYKFCNNC